MLAAYYEGKQIALHRISYQRKDMVVNPQHCRWLTLKQTMDAENGEGRQTCVIAKIQQQLTMSFSPINS